MGWSFHIVRVGGIEVKVHVTFLLFLGWIAYMYGRVGGLAAAFEGVLFVSLIFLCVLFHEFGHAFAARRYGIRTPEITLLPIGGVARLERMPEKPLEEIVVAIAGPAVNVAIAALLWAFITVTGGFAESGFTHAALDLPTKLLGINLWLVIFNMIPAFPMDGGRVLRALLALRTDYLRATHMAAGVGQMIACLFGILGLVGNPVLVLIALFVYFGAASEDSMAQFKSFSHGLRASAAMLTHFQTLPLYATVREAVKALVHSGEHAFPVIDLQGKLRGMVTREAIINALRQSGPQTALSGIMRTDVPSVHYTMPFERAFALLQESQCTALPIVDSNEQLIGLFSPENMKDLMLIQKALAEAPEEEPEVSDNPPPLPTNHRIV
ncbi:MAG: site-2 protease family protein [Chthoniobacteraceae bacterium]|nr:site-2 protease family protein [Chthoniobacteraceae bacterium]